MKPKSSSNRKQYSLSIPIVFMLVFLLFSCSNFSPETSADKLQKILDKGVEKYKVRGVSAAVIFNNDSVWVGASGISHDTVAMQTHMLFSIGSITKNFVAALTLKLAENKVLSLDDKLSDWLPDYQHVDPAITIRQLLNHTSGIFMFWNNDDLWKALIADRTRVWTPEEVLEYIKAPHFKAGEGWRYSNTNYLLMAMIIEKATGSTLAAQLRKHLWEPHNLQHYYLWLADSIPAYQAHVFGDNFQFGAAEQDLTFMPRASHESITFGSSGIVTSAVDLAKWSQVLFEGDVLTQQSMDEMLAFVDFRKVANMKAYGLGVQVFTPGISSFTKAWGHGGGNIGTATYMVYLPEYHCSLVVMVNAFPTSSVDYFTKHIIREIKKTAP